MKPLFIATLFLCLSGCGLETAGTAATSASLKKQELEEGQKTMQRVEDRIEQLNMETPDRLREQEER